MLIIWNFKEHEVFEGKLVEVDESDTPFIWVDEETGKVVSEALTSACTRSKDSYVWDWGYYQKQVVGQAIQYLLRYNAGCI